jgi:PAS domain S-box-containing protein
LTPRFGCFDDERFDELRFERHLSNDPVLALPECWYWIRKTQARVFAGDYASAVDASLRAQRLLWTSPSQLETAEFRFYGALSHAASWDAASPDQRQQHFEALAAHHRQLEIWAEHCPENFANRAALVGREIARIGGREFEAMRLYKQAIRSAHANGFVHHEALAYELAGRFYAARGFDKIAHTNLREARYCYLRWGATAKVRQLDQLYPQLIKEEPAPGPTSTIVAPVELLDLATVIKVSQAVSGEMVLEKLIDSIMRSAIEQAGAERGLLILPRGDTLQIEAEATTSGDDVIVHLRDAPVTATALPEAVLHYVLRTRESVILDDASAENPFSADPYLRQQHARSILCLPLLNQTTLIGMLYLENNLAPRVFAPARIAVLKLLASQAAISLENTRLYRDLAEREAKIRRLVDANIIGICIWELEGRVIEANDAFLHLVGYDREDLVSGRVRWTDLTPPEWLNRNVQRWVPELKMAGSLQPFEKEYVRKDGSRVPVLIGLASFDESGKQGVAFVLDLTARKRAEEALHQAQADLAHVTRLMTMGELTASIAHEVNQPLAGVTTNANAGLRWLAREPPDLEEARACLQRIIRDGQRAGEVIARMRAFARKAAPQTARLALNDVIAEVLALVDGELRRHGVALHTDLAADLPPVRADRVQLQQVLLNLLLNGIEAMRGVTERPRALVVRSRKDGTEGVLVAVQDAGTGIAPQDLERVFTPFYTTKPAGLGLGLSISRAIVEVHDGRLWVTWNDGPGATFQFTLPAGRERAL